MYLAGVLTLMVCQMASTGLSTSLWAAKPETSTKRPAPSSSDPATRARVAQSYGQLPLSFEPNRGQTDPQVKFLSRGRGYQIFLTPKETVLSLRKQSVRQPTDSQRSADRTPNSESRTPDVLRMKLVNTSGNGTFEGQEILPGINNYFIGKDPSKWRTNIPTYRRVVAKQVYPGVDLVYYGQGRQLEYDFIIAPGTDPRTIRFALDIENTKLETGKAKSENRQTFPNPESPVASPEFARVDSNGDLVVALDGGEVRFHKPLVYQEKLAVGSRQLAGSSDQPSAVSHQQHTNPEPLTPNPGISNRQLIDGRYVLLAGNHIGFEVGAYDKSRPLVIDPVLSYSTYLGGIELDAANAIALSSDGAAFIAGETDSVDFPTAHPLQPNVGGPLDFPDDAFVAKISPDGSTLYYSTYLGGSLDERANGIAVDTFGNAYVAGTTISQDFPGSIGAADPNCGDDGRCDSTTNDGFLKSDAFAAKLNPEGSALSYSTFISHLGPPVLDANGVPVLDSRGLPTYYGANDLGQAISVDLNGIAYIVGTTDYSDPACPNVSIGSRENDTFLSRISATGSAFLQRCSSGGEAVDFGGSLEDQAYGVASDNTGRAFLTGVTYSTNFPGCALAGDADAFVMRINTTVVPGAIEYSRCLGGAGRDQGNGIAIDAAGNAYVAGVTNSANFPTTPGVVKPVCTAEGDVFVTKFSPAPAVAYSTCVGGSGADLGASIALDTATNAYVTGFTNSAVDFPVPGIPTTSFQEVYGGGNTDAFVVKLNPAATAFLYASYLGGSNAEDGRGIAVDANGTAYVAGQTCSGDFPSVRPYQEFPGGNCDAFAAKIQVGPGFSLSTQTLNFGAQAVGTSSQPQTITLTSKGDSAVTVTSISVLGDFSVTEDCTGQALPVDSSCTIDVVFEPSTLDPKSGTITIQSDSLSSPDTVNLSGGGSGSAGGFLLTVDPSSQTVNAGNTATFDLDLTPTSGFTGTVNLACSGVPQQSTCSIAPASVNITGAGAQTAILTVRTTARVMAPPAPGPRDFFPRNGLRWVPWMVLLMAMTTFAAARRKRVQLVLAGLMLVMMMWTACGAGGTVVNTPRGTPAGNFSITITATSGTTTQTTAVALKIN